MNIKTKLFIIICIFITLYSCKRDKIDLGIIPIPVSTTLKGGDFILDKQTTIYYENSDLEFSANYLKKIINRSSDLNLKAEELTLYKKNSITLQLIDKSELSEDAYELKVKSNSVWIRASSASGVYYGVQTLLQLLPSEILSSSKKLKTVSIPKVTIKDYPRFKWRGAMLDVARHFFSVSDVKRYIDLISMYKINKLHLHLSDDQGWRIMIDSWPDLALIGGQTEVGGTKGGYYTKEDYSEIIEYAMDRFITVIPEIDMPGHTNAILASYAELNEDGVKKPPYTGINVGFSTLDIDNELTYEFIDDVIREIAEITPGPYIHIGGDEAIPVSNGRPGEGVNKKELKAKYKYFIERVEDIVLSYDKIMIGWDDIKAADLDDSTIKQVWHLKAKKSKNRAILSPADRAYLDMKYNEDSPLGLTWAGYINLEKGYRWDPVADFPNLDPDQVLGVEAPLWSETLIDMKDIEYMAFPRILGYAEISWSRQEDRVFSEYINRVSIHTKRMDELNINYYKSDFINKKEEN